ncbi:hypothetical protein [Pseudonocardia charpentierae]|uniref:Uncharacterized protein n=1 Tax=Pseudonocardia charpentierae TaxID=3075545 RepID=A0ABU2NFY5_9PSEU|nr:hypothetical protein [Pseudonocardia sp. DSM 45834]MDT0352871.1 hypothetical protein [Pseudonocardia sp. DSM 45834]
MAAIAGSDRGALPLAVGAGGSIEEEHAAVIDLLGLVIFSTIIVIGLLDLRSGLGPFAMYRSGAVIGVDRQALVTGRRGDDNQPTPPASAH